jgi:hypothetical protein
MSHLIRHFDEERLDAKPLMQQLTERLHA